MCFLFRSSFHRVFCLFSLAFTLCSVCSVLFFLYVFVLTACFLSFLPCVLSSFCLGCFYFTYNFSFLLFAFCLFSLVFFPRSVCSILSIIFPSRCLFSVFFLTFFPRSVCSVLPHVYVFPLSVCFLSFLPCILSSLRLFGFILHTSFPSFQLFIGISYSSYVFLASVFYYNSMKFSFLCS